MKEAQSLEIQKLTEKYAKAEFLSLMYPDKEAPKASKIIDDLLELVMSGEVEFSHIDRDALLYMGGLEDPEHGQMLKRGETEYLKLQQYASEITGVPLERIRAADEFWFNQLTE